MSDLAVSPDLVGQIIARGSIDAQDVLALRRDAFRDGVVDRAEAETVFRLDAACATKDATWKEFYVDALTDYLVWKAEPKKYVSEDNAAFLIDRIASDGRVDGITELELLINVVRWAESCPERLIMFALEAVRDSVLNPDTALYGADRRPGVIGPADVEIIRTVTYAGASGGGFTISRREADLLFELNNATVAADNAKGWRDLFVKAVANHLMFPRGAPVVPGADEVRRREAWLDERRGVGRLLLDVGRTLGGFRYGQAWRDADMLGSRQKEAKAARETARAHEAAARESVDGAEAAWLIGKIDADGVLHDNERSLLAFIHQNAPLIHPSLDPLLARAGV